MAELSDKHFACKPDADIALSHFIKEQKSNFIKITGSTGLSKIPEKRAKAGRPPKGEKRAYHSCYQVTAISTFDKDLYEQARERLGCFVLISNHPRLSALKILNEHLSQTVVENRFKFIKDPIFVGTLHIKRKGRLEALCYVALSALALYMVLQIRVRKALEKESEPLILAGKKEGFEPTARKILELLTLLR